MLSNDPAQGRGGFTRGGKLQGAQHRHGHGRRPRDPVVRVPVGISRVPVVRVPVAMSRVPVLISRVPVAKIFVHALKFF